MKPESSSAVTVAGHLGNNQLSGGNGFDILGVCAAQASAGMELTGPKLYGDRKEEFYTFLVVGRDTGGGGNTDTIMVMSYDIPNQQLNVLNIPRDTMVNVPWDVKKINSVYNWAANYDRDGIDYLKEEISYLIGFQPDFTMVVEWEAVGELVDAIGPVWFDVPYDMNYDDGTQDLYIHLKAGYQEIDGDKAMQLLRWRKNNKIVDGKLVVYGGYLTGDLGRIETQQIYYVEVMSKMLHYHTQVGEFVLRGTMQSVENELSRYNFVRCNHWYLVNLRHVTELRRDTVLVGQTELEISRRNRKAFLTALTAYVGGSNEWI